MGLFSRKKERSGNSPDDGGGSSTLREQEQLIEEKQDMIQGIEEMSETSVKEVMIPRIDVDFIPVDTPTEELFEKIAESGHSRFPIYSESIDNVIGVLYVKDIIKALSKKEEINLERLVHKPFFVPESKKIDSLLREFKKKHIHIALAIDEYGGVSGIVCMEDIIEEIVGDIQDEFDHENEDIVSLGGNAWLVDARCDLDDLKEKLDVEFPAEDFDTLGGFVFDLFGKIPVKYEKISWKNFDFIVQDMEGHRINLVKVVRTSVATEKEEK